MAARSEKRGLQGDNLNSNALAALSATHEGLMLFPSKFDDGVRFEIAKICDRQPIELGPVTVPTDCITIAMGATSTAIFDMPDRQVLAPIKPGSLILMTKDSYVRHTRILHMNTWIKLATDLARLRSAASFGEYGSHYQSRVFGVVDTHVAQMLWLIFDEAQKGYPSGMLLTEAACLSILGRAHAIGGQPPLRKRPVPKLSRQEKALIRESLQSGSRELTTASISMELGRHPIDFDWQFEATFGRSLQQQLMDNRTAQSVPLQSRGTSHYYRQLSPVHGTREAARWFAAPVEDPRTWNTCRDVHERNGDLAIVFWLNDQRAGLLRLGVRTDYLATKGSLDIIAGDTSFALQDDNAVLPALVIPIEAARLATMGLNSPQPRMLLQTADARLTAVVEQLIAQWNDDHAPGTSDVRQICDLLIGYLSNLLSFDMVNVGEPGLTFRERERIWMHIANQLSEGNSAAELQRITGYARQSFADLFKASFGTTTHQFVLDRMIDAARFLLRRTDLPLTQIAMECGFASHAHLTTTFVQRVGCRPSLYRKYPPALDSPCSRTPRVVADPVALSH